MTTHVQYIFHYHGPFNNFGQHAAGQGTINNIDSPLQTTDHLQSASDQPETAHESQDQPTTIHSAREDRPRDQLAEPGAELKGPPETTIRSPREVQSEEPSELQSPPETTDKSIPTTIVDHTIPRNILVFGQAGSGKSSIINLLARSSLANVSGGPAGSTPSNQHYRISHRGDSYTFWDTPGLDEADNGTVSLGGDVRHLLNLVKAHGVNLLVYCMRGGLVDVTRANYDFFWKIICVEKVPIVLVVTGLEGRDDRDRWWQENIKTIKKMNMAFAGVACVTSWKGIGMSERDSYEESAERVWKLVREHSTPRPWHMAPGWSPQVQRIIVEYQKHFKARTMRKLLRELSRSLVFV